MMGVSVKCGRVHPQILVSMGYQDRLPPSRPLLAASARLGRIGRARIRCARASRRSQCALWGLHERPRRA